MIRIVGLCDFDASHFQIDAFLAFPLWERHTLSGLYCFLGREGLGHLLLKCLIDRQSSLADRLYSPNEEISDLGIISSSLTELS